MVEKPPPLCISSRRRKSKKIRVEQPRREPRCSAAVFARRGRDDAVPLRKAFEASNKGRHVRKRKVSLDDFGWISCSPPKVASACASCPFKMHLDPSAQPRLSPHIWNEQTNNGVNRGLPACIYTAFGASPTVKCDAEEERGRERDPRTITPPPADEDENASIRPSKHTPKAIKKIKGAIA